MWILLKSIMKKKFRFKRNFIPTIVRMRHNIHKSVKIILPPQIRKHSTWSSGFWKISQKKLYSVFFSSDYFVDYFKNRKQETQVKCLLHPSRLYIIIIELNGVTFSVENIINTRLCAVFCADFLPQTTIQLQE